MGRRLLLIALAATASLSGGCRADTEPAHADLPCVRCHDGAPTARVDSASGRLVAAATPEACTSCHEEVSGADVSLGGVSFEHAGHGGDSAVASACASCHTHGAGTEELRVNTTGCALCHASELDGSNPAACRTCHVDPAHTAVTSQGVPLAHGTLPWIGGECIRCHFDVGQPTIGVPAAACTDCHRDAAAIAEEGAGRDLHPQHRSVACATCHEDNAHEVGAMSTSVALDCRQCHAPVHEVGTDDPVLNDAATCAACHADEHAAQQRMVLGVAPAGLPAAPADKFLVGLTCRSCHAAADGASSAASVTCTSCHSPEYAQVLAWWERGTAERVRDARSYVDAASRRARTAEARAHAAAADSLIDFVTSGGAAHNLPLSHDALAAAVARARQALDAAGTPVPVPDPGRRPRMGQCTYCHYTWREPRFVTDMPDAFHREAMERGRKAAQAVVRSP